YHSGRNSAWQKIKISKRQELVIGGHTDPEGSRAGLGALLMGVYEGKKMRYIGRVGTGFNSDNIDELMAKLEKIESTTTAFDVDSPKKSSKVHWVKPKLVAEIEFKAWTGDGILRHASFKGLREDKPAKIAAKSKIQKKMSKESATVDHSHFKITHPDRMIYPKDKIRKIDVANYYKSVAPWMLPHVSDRPLSLMRCPDQAGRNCFFQKHLDTSKMKEIRESQIKDQKVVYIDSEAGLLQLAQWGVLEPHTWQCHVDDGLHPDQIVFDLDPDGQVPWKEVAQTAERLRDLLGRLDLEGFLKTTGGKGLHIHVPIQPLYTWEQVKGFAKTVCQQLESENPGHYTTKMSKKIRIKKIFLDYLRNGFGATAVAPFSLRSKEHATVAMPIGWDELKKIKGGDEFDIKSSLTRLAHQKKDPWKDYFKTKQKIKILKPG
ncbi:MAG: DNA ligase D, partial [Bdellovibrionaceae bacterium]|nr:DNA ligase D [Pseudobdellovibrionaceae bacterium]